MKNVLLDGFGIVITRPTDQAKKLSALVEKARGQAFNFPLIAISPLQNYENFNATIANLTLFDWIIFISSNAVQNAMPRIQKTWGACPTSLKFAAIGPVTAKELENFGVSNILIPKDRFDSESLLSLPEMQQMQGKKVMIVRGVGGREILADTLIARGAEVTFAECYQRINPQKNCAFLKNLWQENKCHALVVTSSEAMEHLLAMAAMDDENWQSNNSHWLNHLHIFVNHARIAEHAHLKSLNIHIAETAGDEAMLNCLVKVLNPS